jgi:hypothetical protein
MTDRPILFSSAMVRALLAGTKTQTRRIMKEPYGMMERCFGEWKPIPTKVYPGDRLWVRENAAIQTQRWHHEDGHSYSISYRADQNGSGQWLGLPNSGDSQRKGEPPYVFPKRSHNKSGSMRWQPSIHMPRWASRLTLTVTDVRVERLQDISETDAVAEGADVAEGHRSQITGGPMVKVGPGTYMSPIAWYHRLWNEINGVGAWDANPWVVAYTFSVHHSNIDQMAKEAA